MCTNWADAFQKQYLQWLFLEFICSICCWTSCQIEKSVLCSSSNRGISIGCTVKPRVIFWLIQKIYSIHTNKRRWKTYNNFQKLENNSLATPNRIYHAFVCGQDTSIFVIIKSRHLSTGYRWIRDNSVPLAIWAPVPLLWGWYLANPSLV